MSLLIWCDTQAEIELVKKACAKLGVEAVMADHWA